MDSWACVAVVIAAAFLGAAVGAFIVMGNGD
jgi:hypothetical protein